MRHFPLNHLPSNCLLHLYSKYKKNDSLNESILINYKNGVWSTHSAECTNNAVLRRNSKCNDKNVCEKCFGFHSIQLVKDRVKRIEKIYHIEPYPIESTDSKTGYLEVTYFLRGNTSKASSASKLLRERCLKYISHQD